jgi:hypothetical protein
MSSSLLVRQGVLTGSMFSAPSLERAQSAPRSRRLLHREMRTGETKKPLPGGELVAYSLARPGQDRGGFS